MREGQGKYSHVSLLTLLLVLKQIYLKVMQMFPKYTASILLNVVLIYFQKREAYLAKRQKTLCIVLQIPFKITLAYYFF